MNEARPARWQRLERDERRSQILACARELFSQRNFAAVSMSDIARDAGVARGLLHHYFGSKRDLYLEVVRSLMRMPSNPVPSDDHGRGLEAAIEESVERWLGCSSATGACGWPRSARRASAATPRSRRSSTTRASRRPIT